MPVCAVSSGPIVVVVSGSSRATSGMIILLTMAIFRCWAVWVMMANWETSAADPAVVGMQIMGGPGSSTRSTPSNSRMER